MEGLVTLLEANRPTVELPDGSTFLCYLKGRIKRDIGRIMVGDQVVFEATDPGEGRIERVVPRKNQLLRPPVANVSGVFVVFSLVHPEGSLELLDRRLVMARVMGLNAEIVLAKIDVVHDLTKLKLIESAYRRIGYPVWPIASPTGQGVDPMTHQGRRGIWVLTGESGVGKSTLLKAIIPEADAETQQLSRIGRGQQTTRWVRLYNMDGYWLADSPGYTALDSTAPDVQTIADAFPEFDTVQCRFSDCLHRQEPDCGVTAAVALGHIADWRYRHYLKLLSEWVKVY